jgi:hypothetical protein
MRLRFALVLLFTNLLAFGQDPLSPARKIALFNGRDLNGWYTWVREDGLKDPSGVFTVANGMIRISGEKWGGIATEQPYRDYHLVVEWRWGSKTWAARESKARDSGILIHGVGPDGAVSGVWLESIESQIIEGGSGDILFVAGKAKPTGSAKIRSLGKEIYWDPAGAPTDKITQRVDWWGRSPEWKDELGFRGPQDVEKPVGQWNRQEIYAEGDRISYVLNGKLVNQAYNLTHTAGKIQIQSEGAEIFVRKVQIQPLRSAPPIPSKQISKGLQKSN